MSNIVLSWNIISELQNPSEWYCLNRKTIFYRSKRSKPGPNRSIWRILSKFRIFQQKNPPIFSFGFIVRGVFLEASEGFGTGFGWIRTEKWRKTFFSRKSFFSTIGSYRTGPDRKKWNSKKSKIFDSTNCRPGIPRATTSMDYRLIDTFSTGRAGPGRPGRAG